MPIFLIAIILAILTPALAQNLTSMAKADGKGHVNLQINYYAEDTCVYFKEVRKGVPSSIEPTKRSLPVTVIIDRHFSKPCEQKLRVLTHEIQLDEKPGINNAEIFYISTDGKFIRSAKPRIYRSGELESEG